MLKDRRVLMEKDMLAQKAACGALYLKIVNETADNFEIDKYDSMKTKLSDMIIELDIVNQMIANGHK